jgi:hypothetical protein
MSVDSVWLVNTVAWLHREPVKTDALIVLEGLL